MPMSFGRFRKVHTFIPHSRIFRKTAPSPIRLHFRKVFGRGIVEVRRLDGFRFVLRRGQQGKEEDEYGEEVFHIIQF